MNNKIRVDCFSNILVLIAVRKDPDLLDRVRARYEELRPLIDENRARGRDLITSRRTNQPNDAVYKDAFEKFNTLMYKLNNIFDNLTDGIY